jgi:hypothetical protein
MFLGLSLFFFVRKRKKSESRTALNDRNIPGNGWNIKKTTGIFREMAGILNKTIGIWRETAGIL